MDRYGKTTQFHLEDNTMPLLTTTVGPLYFDDQGGEDRPLSVLWPSLFTDHSMWNGQTVALHEAGWRTLAIDPPGHGQSPGPGRPFTMDDCADAVLQILDSVAVDSPVAILGTSWGGFVAPRIALRAPSRVAGIALFNTSAERSTTLERARAALLVKLLGIKTLDKMNVRFIVSALLAPETRKQRPNIGSDLGRHFLEWDRESAVTSIRSVLIDRDSILDRLPEIDSPALVVSGGEDHTLPAVHSRQIADRLAKSRYVEVSSAAHLVPLEAPQVANSLLIEFLGSISSRT